MRHVPVAAFLALTACAGSADDYPSLAIRDVERIDYAEIGTSDESDVAAPVASQEVIERVAALRAQALADHANFVEAAPVARRLVRAGAGADPTSTARGSAEVAISDLSSLRSQTAIPLADLDAMLVAASTALEPTAEIAEARDAVARLIAEEDQVLSELRAIL